MVLELVFFALGVLLLLLVIFLGGRRGGSNVGPMAALAHVVFALTTQTQQANLPYVTLQFYMASFFSIGALDAVGGLKTLQLWETRLLRKWPQVVDITFPLLAFLNAILGDNMQLTQCLFCDVVAMAGEAGVSPRRSLRMAVPGALLAMCTGPITAPTLWLVDQEEAKEGERFITYLRLFRTTLLGSFLSVLIVSVVAHFLGRYLTDRLNELPVTQQTSDVHSKAIAISEPFPNSLKIGETASDSNQARTSYFDSQYADKFAPRLNSEETDDERVGINSPGSAEWRLNEVYRSSTARLPLSSPDRRGRGGQCTSVSEYLAFASSTQVPHSDDPMFATVSATTIKTHASETHQPVSPAILPVVVYLILFLGQLLYQIVWPYTYGSRSNDSTRYHLVISWMLMMSVLICCAGKSGPSIVFDSHVVGHLGVSILTVLGLTWLTSTIFRIPLRLIADYETSDALSSSVSLFMLMVGTSSIFFFSPASAVVYAHDLHRLAFQVPCRWLLVTVPLFALYAVWPVFIPVEAALRSGGGGKVVSKPGAYHSIIIPNLSCVALASLFTYFLTAN